MGQQKEFFFSKHVSLSFNHLIKEYQEKYVPKKGRRFNADDITYEVGEPAIQDAELEFEISCKIPEAEIGKSHSLGKYFEEVKKIVSKAKRQPVEIGMDEIVRKGNENEMKTRDYVRLKFNYPISELQNDEELLKRYNDIKESGAIETIPEVPGINSVLGGMVLKMVEEKAYSLCSQNMNDLIKANDKVRKGGAS